MAKQRGAWYGLLILFGINTMNFYDRQIFSAVAELVRKEWTLSDTQLGTLGTAFILMYAVVGLPLGRLADTRSRRKILGISISLWSILTAASGLAPNFSWLFAGRLAVGVGEAGCAPAANSLIGDLYPPKRRAMALSIFMLGIPIGLFLSYLLSGLIAQAFSWREAFYFACIPGLILGLLAFSLPDPQRGALEGHPAASKQRPGSPFWIVLGIPTILWIIISGALHNFNAYAVNAFLPAFLMRTHLMAVKDATSVTAIVLGAVGIIGLLAGGWMGDRIGSKRKDGKLLMTSVAMVVAAPAYYFALQQPPGATVTFMLLMGTGSMFAYVYYAGVYASIQDVVEPRLRGTAMALYFFAMYILGASLGPVVTGMMSDHFAKQAMTSAGATTMTETFKADGLHNAMYVIPMVCAVLAVVLFAASRVISKDMEKLKKWQSAQAVG
jgi:MFS family permease